MKSRNFKAFLFLIAVTTLIGALAYRETREEKTSSDLSNENFIRVDFRGKNMSGTDLRGKTFGACLAGGVDFRNAQLAGIKSVDGQWNKADFRDSDLRFAQFIRDNFEGADFRGANMGDALMLPANLHGALFDDRTRLPFSKEIALKLGMLYVAPTP
jgi:uncharacterized protein YjbI with pentapeptide repeats